MRNCLLFLFFILLYTCVKGQVYRPTGSMVIDAIRMDSVDNFVPDSATKFFNRLRIYYGIESPNPFLRSGVLAGNPTLQNPSFLSSLLGLDVTMLADGLARFFVKRTKQELTAAFFDRFKRTLNDPASIDLRLVFPQTHNTLQALGDDIYDFEPYLTTLRESFDADLHALPPHLQRWLYEGSLKGPLANHKDLRIGAWSGLYFYDELSSKTHPGDVIANFPTDSLMGLTLNVSGKTILVQGAGKTFIAFSKSLWSAQKNKKYWVSPDTLRRLLISENASKYYLAFLYPQLDTVQILSDGTTMGTLLTQWNSDFNRNLKPKLENLKYFLAQAEELETKLQSAREKNITDSIRYERTFLFFEQFTTTLRAGFRTTQDWTTIPSQQLVRFDTVLTVIDNTAKVGIDVVRRKYGTAVVHAVGIYNYLKRSDNSSTHKRIAEEFLRYGTLMAGVAEAKNSQEVADVIETFALPTGSSSIKRRSAFNVALNGYTGLLAGRDLTVSSPYINTYAVWAPVGITVNFGRVPFGGWQDHSISLFASIIDIGAITAFRFTDESTVTLKKILLKDIISPGLAVSWGIARTPLSLTFGWQSAPLLKEVTVDANTTLDYRTSRVYATLAVDIPILNFYNQKYWKYR